MASDEEAEQFLAYALQPRLRVRPRVSEALNGIDAREVKTPGGSLAAWRLGEGPAILLIHGWEDDHSLWTRMILALEARGRGIVVFDLPAHGFSEGEICTPALAARAIAAVAAQMGPIEAVVTHSFGGPAAALAMTQGLSVERAVFIAPPLMDGSRWGQAEHLADAPAELKARARDLYEARDASAKFDVLAAARGLSARALIAHSADDEEVPLSEALAIADAWPGAETLIVDGLGHRLIAQEPDVIGRVIDFLD
ncbi:MAG: alpha/beta fold hydrolase [Hyphomonadaceae bacterium]